MQNFITVILIFVFIRFIIHACHIHPKPEEYLKVLSLTEWKTGREIGEELEQIYNGKISKTEMYYNLNKLVRQDLADRVISKIVLGGYVIKVYKYKRKNGRRKIPREKKPLPVFDPEMAPA